MDFFTSDNNEPHCLHWFCNIFTEEVLDLGRCSSDDMDYPYMRRGLLSVQLLPWIPWFLRFLLMTLNTPIIGPIIYYDAYILNVLSLIWISSSQD